MNTRLKNAFLYLISKNSTKRHYLFVRLKDMLKKYYHYLRVRKDVLESGIFDENFYLLAYEDVRKSDIAPMRHYITYGKEEGRLPNAQGYEPNSRSLPPNEDFSKSNAAHILTGNKPLSMGFFGPVQHYPLVSIISVNYNGAEDLPCFLDALIRQTYKHFEVIIVDNHSSDRSEEIVLDFKSKFRALKFIKLEKNIGFADGNNQAIPFCKGEFIALINIDTQVDPDWLKELVDAASSDSRAAAVTSKMHFFERFQDIEISGDEGFSVDIDKLEDSLAYKKYFIRSGIKLNGAIISSNNTIIISLPIQKKKVDIHFRDIRPDKSQYVGLKIGRKPPTHYVLTHSDHRIQLDLSSENSVSASWIINNAGSVTRNGFPADRGFGEYDRGQYDQKCYVDFFCGCSVLLRRSAIIDRKIFVPEFFAYFEDSELSRWLAGRGYKILYVPRSIVRHRHSATSSEGSHQWKMLVERSRAIYTHTGDVKELDIILKHNEKLYRDKVNILLFNSVVAFNRPLIERLERQKYMVEPVKSVGIYNSYWNTMGGGEKHALYFANILQRKYTVYLISETDFDLNKLSSYFNIDLSNCRKVIEPWFSEEFTGKFHIFINSTFQSNLNSIAANSYYIVSFPHKNINKAILPNYRFLYNSDYTAQWAQNYWGKNHMGSILYPIGSLEEYCKNRQCVNNKQKIILSVGRFFIGSHSKNQHFIAKAFRRLNEQCHAAREWKIVLIGSLDLQNYSYVKYVNTIKSVLAGLNHEIIVNADREILDKYYSKSSLYIHATGYGQDPEREPENFEHFGITPLEAMLHNCYPIVFHLGGPADILKRIQVGETFLDLEDLVERMQNNIYKFDPFKISDSIDISKNTEDFIKKNSLDNLINSLM